MLQLQKISCSTQTQILFKNLSLTVLPSSIIYIHGPNGCGKTSLLRIICGIQKPTDGKIIFSNKFLSPLYIGHNLGIKQEFTVIENLEFWANSYNSPELVMAAIHYFSLQDLLEIKCYRLSAGNQKKLSLSKLIACKSELWILDEVEANLDEENKILLHNLIISKANNGGIIFITTHASILPIKSAQNLYLKDYK